VDQLVDDIEKKYDIVIGQSFLEWFLIYFQIGIFMDRKWQINFEKFYIYFDKFISGQLYVMTHIKNKDERSSKICRAFSQRLVNLSALANAFQISLYKIKQVIERYGIAPRSTELLEYQKDLYSIDDLRFLFL